MSKLSLCLTSLVAAIPGGLLAALMVMTILGNFNEMPTAFTVLAGIVLALSAFVAVLPLGILLFGPRAPQAIAAKDDEEVEELAAVAAEEEYAAAEVGDFGDDEFETAEFEADDEFAEDEEWDEEEK